MTGPRRVAVTGLGAISALGHSVAESWTTLCEARSGIAMHTLDPGPLGPAPQTLPLAMVTPGYEAPLEARFGKRVSSSLDPFAALALCAAFEALGDAKLLDAPELRRRAAIVLGHGFGGGDTLEKTFQRFYGEKSARLHPATIPRAMMSAAASAVSMSFGVCGPVFVTSSACASSAHAIAQGAALIVSGQAELAIVGGSEAMVTPTSLRAWQAIRALASETCRPFSAGRDGLVMGEGAGILVLEELEHARQRGATVYSELIGVGLSSDAHDLTQPSLDGAVAALGKACESERILDADDVLISAHGTGTLLNDQNEAAAIHKVFGARAATHPVIATKSAHGHLLGGSAALQAVIGMRALTERLAPPILNYLAPDPSCQLDLVLGRARPISSDYLVVNAFAFGGLNACLAFARA